MQIFSKVESGLLLHGIQRITELSQQSITRRDLSNSNDSLQIASLRLKELTSFKPHSHLEKSISDYRTRAQECWVVITGLVKVSYYDLDDSFLEELVLFPGDISYTFKGGHGYEILQANSLVYEFKSGPYYGPDLDKRFILK